MKKVSALSAALLLIFTLCACGNSQGNSKEETQKDPHSDNSLYCVQVSTGIKKSGYSLQFR